MTAALNCIYWLLSIDAAIFCAIGVWLIASDHLPWLSVWLGTLHCIAAIAVLAGICHANPLYPLAFGFALLATALGFAACHRDEVDKWFLLLATIGGGVLLLAHVLALSLRILAFSALPAGGMGGSSLGAPLLPGSGMINVAQDSSPQSTASVQGARLVPGDDDGGEHVSEPKETVGEEAEARQARRGYGTLQLLRIARPHRSWLYWGCAVLLVRLPLSLSIPHWVAESIGCVARDDIDGAYRNVAYLLVCGTGDAILDFWCVYLFGAAQQRIIRGLRLDLYASILSQDIAFFDATKSGEITSRLTADCAEMANDLTWVFRFTIEALVRIGGILAYMFYRSWRLGLLALAIIPITSLINRSYATFMHRNQEKVQSALAEANSVATEAIGAIRTVAAFATEPSEHERYRRRVDVYFRLIMRQFVVQGLYYAMCNTFLINTVVQGALLAYGSYLHKELLLDAHVLLAFMLYQGQLQEYFQNLFNSFTSLLKSSGAAAKVIDYIERRPRYAHGGTVVIPGMEFASSAAAAQRYKSSTRVAQTSTLWGASIGGRGGGSGGGSGGCAVTLRNVFFAYPTRPETEVLCNFSLEVPCGRRVALVGASGNGKSTVFSLLVHFYEARSGSVALDGVDVKEMRHELLHQRVALVSQEPVLMSGTVEENILYGLGAFAHAADGDDAAVVEARRSTLRARLIAAATAANAHSFIMHELGDGYQTPVGERGVQLSGGQKQRIAIARCLMLDPQLLLLDEATSALDTESEAAVQLALETAMVGRTTLIIAHRLSTVRHADQIVMMHAGAVVEQGTHVELMAKQLPADGRPSYRHLVGEQVESGAR